MSKPERDPKMEALLNRYYDSVEYRAAVYADVQGLTREQEMVVRDQLRRRDELIFDGVPVSADD